MYFLTTPLNIGASHLWWYAFLLKSEVYLHVSGDDGPIPKKLEKKRTMFLYLIQSLIDMTRIFLQKRANLELKTRKEVKKQK